MKFDTSFLVLALIFVALFVPGCGCGGAGDAEDAQTSTATSAATPFPQKQTPQGTAETKQNTTQPNQQTQSNVSQAQSFSPEPVLSISVSGDLTKGYLKEGQQSRKTAKITQIANSITSTDQMQIVNSIMSWLRSNLPSCGSLDGVRALTAEQIINSGCARGCTDYALVFVTLARAKGISASYTDTIETNYLNKIKSDGNISGMFYGHAFSDVYVNGQWITVNPTSGNVLQPGNYINGESGNEPYTVFARGLDNLDFGYDSDAEFKQKVASVYGISYS